MVMIDSTSTNSSGRNVPLSSAIYEGSVRHRRYSPRSHDFTYQVFMVYLDLQEFIFGFGTWARRQFSDADHAKPYSDAAMDFCADHQHDGQQ